MSDSARSEGNLRLALKPAASRGALWVRTALVASVIGAIAIPVLAAGLGGKPGLWEAHITKQVVNGNEVMPQINSAAAQMQKAMANMTPEQRAQVESMMKGHGGFMGAGGSNVRICVTPEMANRDTLWTDPAGRCQPAKISRSGNRATFEINCAADGTTTTGKGETLVSGDSMTTQLDMTMRSASGDTRVTHTETSMTFISSDCGDVKPLAAPGATAGH